MAQINTSDTKRASQKKARDKGTGGKPMVMTPDEYKQWSAEQGRYMGRKEGQKIVPPIEEVRMAIKAGSTKSDMMYKWGLSKDEVNNLIVRLARSERRERPIQVPE